MKTKNVGVSIDFLHMVYTIHLFDGEEFGTVTQDIPGPAELLELVKGIITHVIEIPEELVEIPKEVFRAILNELKEYLI